MNPLAITQFNLPLGGVTFSRPVRIFPLHCGTCGKWFWLESPNLDYLLNNMELGKSVFEFLKGEFGVSCYRNFLKRHFIGFTKRFGRDSIKGIIPGLLKRSILIYDYIVEYKGKRYYISCYRDRKTKRYRCYEITPVIRGEK
jgi:hypothetical protein